MVAAREREYDEREQIVLSYRANTMSSGATLTERGSFKADGGERVFKIAMIEAYEMRQRRRVHFAHTWST